MALHGLVYKVKKINQIVNNMGELVIRFMSFWIMVSLPTLLFKAMNKMRGLVDCLLSFWIKKSVPVLLFK